MITSNSIIDDEVVSLRADYYRNQPQVAVMHCTVHKEFTVEDAWPRMRVWRRALQSMRAEGKLLLFAVRPPYGGHRWDRFCTAFGFKPHPTRAGVMWRYTGV